jgi:hypothetical protein
MRRSALSNHVLVPTPEDLRVPSPESNGRATAEAVEEGVLSNLPRTRPQRTTERRLASREGKRSTGGPRRRATGDSVNGSASSAGATANGTAGEAAKGATGATAKSTPKPKRAARATTPRKPRKANKPTASKPAAAKDSAPRGARAEPVESAPRQGFESEPSRTTGAVQPPGGTELVAGAVEIVGELARAGVSAGERALKDLFSRLPH